MTLQYNYTTTYPKFLADYNHIADSSDSYFNGNNDKNKWFNSNSEKDINDANQYILYKELGDTLQAYYAAKRIGYNVNQYKLCLFTNDINLMYRCILLQVPVCVSRPCGTLSKQFHYHPAMSDIKQQWDTMHRDAIVEHNQHAMNQINRVLQRGFYYTQNEYRIQFTKESRLAKFLSDCIRKIRSVTDQFLSISSTTMKLHDYYYALSSAFKASRLFNQSVVNNSSQSLFIKVTPTSMPFTQLFPYPFGDYLLTFSRSGGGSDYTQELDTIPYIQDPTQTDYTCIDATQNDEHLPIVYVLHTLYILLKEQYPEKSESMLRFMTEDINGKLIQLFGAIGTPIWDKLYLKDIISMYLSGKLQTITYLEFEAFHIPFVEKALENDWEWQILNQYTEKTSIQSIAHIVDTLLHKNTDHSVIVDTQKYIPMIKARRTTRRRFRLA